MRFGKDLREQIGDRIPLTHKTSFLARSSHLALQLHPASLNHPTFSRLEERRRYRELRRTDPRAARESIRNARQESAVDETLIPGSTFDTTCRTAGEIGLPKDGFEFQMLYGVQREWQKRLVEQGYRLRIYIPFGKEWFPYFMRRLAERPANVVFAIRSLLG